MPAVNINMTATHRAPTDSNFPYAKGILSSGLRPAKYPVTPATAILPDPATVTETVVSQPLVSHWKHQWLKSWPDARLDHGQNETAGQGQGQSHKLNALTSSYAFALCFTHPFVFSLRYMVVRHLGPDRMCYASVATPRP
eukprot:1196112-Prorocentrum_minimum.AAC.8